MSTMVTATPFKRVGVLAIPEQRSRENVFKELESHPEAVLKLFETTPANRPRLPGPVSLKFAFNCHKPSYSVGHCACAGRSILRP